VTTVLLVGFVAIEGHKSVTPTREAHKPVTFVQFQLHAPDAEGVRLAGTFTDWQPMHELHQVFPGVWTVILPLSAGVHDYAFLVNGGDWVADPYVPVVQDGFGGQANRMALLPPQGESPL
jgi:1,4-alpha-glucan branching enzyme